MTWKDRNALRKEVVETFVEAQRLRGVAQTGRDDPRPRVELDPFAPTEDPLPPMQPPTRPLHVDPEDEPVEYGDRPVVVEVEVPRRPPPRRDAGAPRYRPPKPPMRRRRSW